MENFYLEKAKEVADLIDNSNERSGRLYDDMFSVLEIGNSWTPYTHELNVLYTCYVDKGLRGRDFGMAWDKVDRTTFVQEIARILKENGKTFNVHTETSIYVFSFECEHNGDFEGEKKRCEEAGAKIVTAKWDEMEEVGYIYFSVPMENVGQFEKGYGKLWQFRKCA